MMTIDAGMPGAAAEGSHLRRTIRPAGFFALSFGTIVGSGWVILLGEWLKLAGPGGAMLAFLAGGAFMLLVGACYGELAARMPIVGGEFTYASRVLGPRTGFIVGWFLILFMVGFCAFEGIAFGWLIETLFPALKGVPLYAIAGTPITSSAVWIGLVGVIMIATINVQAVDVSVMVQKIITYAFIVVSAVFIASGFLLGNSYNLDPLFPVFQQGSWLTGAVWIFSTCSVFLNGFQAALHAIEERAPDVTIRRVILPMIGGIGAAALFYMLLVLSASRAVPWASLTESQLPAAAAFGGLHGAEFLRPVVLGVASISLFKTWNALLIMASRLVYAQAIAGFLPAPLARLTRSGGVPASAVLLISLVSIGGILAGRGAVIPIVNTSTICVSISIVLSIAVLLRLQATDPTPASFNVPGGRAGIVLAMLGTAGMACIALFEPFTRGGGFPVEWIILVLWGVVGWVAAMFRTTPSA